MERIPALQMRDFRVCVCVGRVHKSAWVRFLAISKSLQIVMHCEFPFVCMNGGLNVVRKTCFVQSIEEIGVSLMGLLMLDPRNHCRVCADVWKQLIAPSMDRLYRVVTRFEFEKTKAWWRTFVCCLGLVSSQHQDSNLVDSASSIRLSQRLSHACLSINNFIRETANGSLYQL